jgi:hypothetical protein
MGPRLSVNRTFQQAHHDAILDSVPGPTALQLKHSLNPFWNYYQTTGGRGRAPIVVLHWP